MNMDVEAMNDMRRSRRNQIMRLNEVDEEDEDGQSESSDDEAILQESHAAWLARVTGASTGDAEGGGGGEEGEEDREEEEEEEMEGEGEGTGGALYNADTGRFYTKSTASNVSEASSVDEDEGEDEGGAEGAGMRRTESGRSDVSALTDYSEGDGPYYGVGDRVLALFDDEVNLYPGTIEEVYESEMGFAYSGQYLNPNNATI